MGQRDVVRAEDVAELAREEAGRVAWMLPRSMSTPARRSSATSPRRQRRARAAFSATRRASSACPLMFGVMPGIWLEEAGRRFAVADVEVQPAMRASCQGPLIRHDDVANRHRRDADGEPGDDDAPAARTAACDEQRRGDAGERRTPCWAGSGAPAPNTRPAAAHQTFSLAGQAPRHATAVRPTSGTHRARPGGSAIHRT